MKDLYLLLSPRLLGIRNIFFDNTRGTRRKAVIMSVVGLFFWLLMFLIFCRVLIYFQSVELIGDILARHLLAMVLLTFFSLLIFSHVITALSNLYLSADLELCYSSPVDIENLFISRAVYTMVDSSWMVIVFGLPVMLAYAYVYKPGPGFYIALLHVPLAVTIIAAGLGIIFTMIMVSIFPAQRTRDIIMLMVILVIIALYLLFRFLRPERLVNPDAFFSIMQYVTALQVTDSPYLPTHWATEILWSRLGDTKGHNAAFNVLLLWSSASAIFVINVWIAGIIYFSGFSKSQEAKRRRRGRGILDIIVGFIKKPLAPDTGAMLEKDIRNFFRDNTQWSQLLLLGALIIVYIYNFSVLPLERSPIRLDFLQNEIAFLNMGLAGFVLAAVSVRFIFPAVSSEGGAFWIIRSSPLSNERFLWGKFALYIIPMLSLGGILIITTNCLLHVTSLMMFLSSITMFLIVFSIVAMGVGFGAMYPNFKYENISQVATGFGGLMYMILSAVLVAFIIVLEAGPVYILFMADLKGTEISLFQWIMIIPAFTLVLVMNLFTVYKFMKMGSAALENYR
ncbi:MAG: hypothetical protein JW882_14095 [Deltaproteobacteria bacterium]|nr:hypothetical protein [Deltaproteobacteria bacterium]